MAYSEREFYGGAIAGAIPAGWIDSSDLREVPDHQEIYLSPTTLSNFILEVNEAVPNNEALAHLDQQQQQSTAPAGGVHANKETIDKAAVNYHLHDLCDEGDTIQAVIPPAPISLPRFKPEHQARAYKGLASFTTPKTQRKGGGRVPGSVDGSVATTTMGASGGVGGTDAPQVSRLSCHYLLVRLEKQETDLLAFMNVPHDEFDTKGDPAGLSREEELATGFVDKLVETLEVRNWELFG